MVHLLRKARNPTESDHPQKQKARKFSPPGLRYVSLRWMLYQDINAWTEGREAPYAAYSSNKYTRRDSQRTFIHLYRSVRGQVKLGVSLRPPLRELRPLRRRGL